MHPVQLQMFTPVNICRCGPTVVRPIGQGGLASVCALIGIKLYLGVATLGIIMRDGLHADAVVASWVLGRPVKVDREAQVWCCWRVMHAIVGRWPCFARQTPVHGGFCLI